VDRLSILIVEDEPLICQSYREYADRLDDVSLIGSTDDAAKACEMIQDHLPQAIILDLELQNGSGSGLDVLQNMEQMRLAVKPFVLIVTNNQSNVIQRRAREYKNTYIISKYQHDYSEAYCLDFLRELKTEILKEYSARNSRSTDIEPPVQAAERIFQRIHTELNNVYISPRVLGYKYLTDAIWLTIQAPRQNLADEIAAKCHKTPISVTRAMQNAIKHAWRIADLDDLAAHYTARIDPDKGVPTVMEFVYYYADKLKAEYQM